MMYMVNKIAAPKAVFKQYDKQLFYVKDKGDLSLLKPAFPLALNVVLPRLAPLECATLAGEVFKLPGLTNDAKGRMLEFYLIYAISKSRCDMPCSVMQSMQSRSVLPISVNKPVVVRFPGKGVPAGPLPTTPTLYVPQLGTYGDVDFLIYDPSTNAHPVLWAFQVTLRNHPWQHVNEWKTGTATDPTVFDAWKQFCPANTQLFKVWIVRANTSAPTSKPFLAACRGHRWSSVDKLIDYFPALENLKL